VIKTQSHPEPFPLVSKMPLEEQLALERKNIQSSIKYAKEQLGL
jgi:hypothetical protein